MNEMCFTSEEVRDEKLNDFSYSDELPEEYWKYFNSTRMYPHTDEKWQKDGSN